MRLKFSLIFPVIAIALAMSLHSQQQPQMPDSKTAKVETEILKTSSDSPFPELQLRNSRYQLRPGDVLELRFSSLPDFNQTIPIHPDGFVALREVGDLYISGMTLPEARAALARQYSQIMQTPEVTVELKEFEKPHFTAGGELNRPGRYEMNGDVTLSEAVQLAGGFTDAAKHSQVLVFRRISKDNVIAKKVNLKELLANANLNEDIHLQPGDLVYVPKNTISKLKGLVVPRVVIGPTWRP